MTKQNKRPIDVRRASAGSMDVGLPEEGHIKEIYTIGNDRLIMVKERATYEISFADKIDPERTNEGLPNVQQRILQAGSEDELVQSVLLTARVLIDDTYLPQLDCGALRQHALDALRELLAMNRIRSRVSDEQKSLIEQLEGQKLKNGFIVPSLNDLEQELKNVLQRADHFTRELFKIVRAFEPQFRNLDNLLSRAKSEKPVNEIFVEFIGRASRFLKYVREARNAVEHPLPEKRVIVRDFELSKDGSLMPPSIEIIHPRYAQPRVGVTAFFDEMIRSLVAVFGEMLANLCARKASVGGFDVGVVLVPEEERTYSAQKYAYAVRLENGWQRIG